MNASSSNPKKGLQKSLGDEFKKQISSNSEHISSTSRDKRNKNKKYVHSTNPTSENSSFKASSVISNQDIQASNYSSKDEIIFYDENYTIINLDKRSKKSKGKKNKKSLKSARPKYRYSKYKTISYSSGSDQNDENEGHQRANSRENCLSESIWNQDLEQSLFPSNKRKKSGKQKKKQKEQPLPQKKPPIEQKPEASSKPELQKPKPQTDSKPKQKEVKDSKPLKFEESKLNFPKPTQNKSHYKPSPQCNPHSTSYYKPPKYYSQNSHNSYQQHHQIPSKTVSSFYQ